MSKDREIDWMADRPGERTLAVDPAKMAGDGHVVFIGRVRSPWLTRSDCPKNLRQARESLAQLQGLGQQGVGQSGEGQQGERPSCWLEIDPAYRAGLAGLEAASHVILLYWMHMARRDLIVQAPRHVGTARGVFGLRSPVRPNPIGLGVVKLLGLDPDAGRLVIDAIDCLDGTPLIDIKPYFAAADAFPEATVAER